MDDAERLELHRAHTDVIAIAAMATQGVVAICGELVGKGVFGTAELARISDFMLASLGPDVSEGLQAQLHESVSFQFSALVRDAPDENR